MKSLQNEIAYQFELVGQYKNAESEILTNVIQHFFDLEQRGVKIN
jgi:hypothetical protein